MIISKSREWVIATPPKCGTVSLQSALVPKFATKSRHRHTMTWNEVGWRYMMVRNPYERWAAIYWRHNQRAGQEGIYLSELAHDINKYVPQWWKERLVKPVSPWSFNLKEMADVFKPNVYFKIENGLNQILTEVDFPGLVPHVNKNTSEKKMDWLSTAKLLTDANLARVMEFCEPDMKRFKY